jgi:hypothetical protein
VNYPIAITRQDLCDRIRAAGFDPETLQELRITRHGIRVTALRQDEEGIYTIGPDPRQPAVEIVDIAVDDYAQWESSNYGGGR